MGADRRRKGEEARRRGEMTHKSAPMVALYWFEKRLLTYWFIRDVFPTLFSIDHRRNESG
jgi:hypothetical protein